MTAGSVQADLRRLPWWVTVPLVLIALVVLALRAVGLVVAVVVTTAERLDVAAAVAAGIAPLGASTWLLSAAVPAPDWTRPGGDR
ncbi:putative membrane protein [Candidatus Protofrankia californiensis]|uniref:Putative membrane protein n=1 Tax=Candidatus Protofrankia californiensis TaxID=1839754 RepID=A0A1C3NT23_9ACTN|nr:putative membrane protein [Candidatus Protofrankia californiensis]